MIDLKTYKKMINLLIEMPIAKKDEKKSEYD